jgi:hypothetical protein
MFKNSDDKFNDFDRKIAFSAGLFIFTTSIMNNYVNEINKFINNFFNPS